MQVPCGANDLVAGEGSCFWGILLIGNLGVHPRGSGAGYSRGAGSRYEPHLGIS
jgi:hypothetical protein